MTATLTTVEQRDPETFEGVVQAGIDTFVEVGRALAEIRDRRLYRARLRHVRGLLPRAVGAGPHPRLPAD